MSKRLDEYFQALGRKLPSAWTNAFIMDKRPLKIYRASAGSGKTFRLAAEYIKILIADPHASSNILAVTFTNKATAEMKGRILSTLYGIGHGLKSSEAYMADIRQSAEIVRLHISDEEIRRRARSALDLIVHNYSTLRIETIDAFFQSVVRLVAHELRLTNNLRLDLDTDAVLQLAVGDLLDSMSAGGVLSSVVERMVEQRISNGKNWRVEGDIVSLSGHIFNERYLKHKSEARASGMEQGINGSTVLTMRDRLFALRESAENSAMASAQRLLDEASRRGMSSASFVQGKNGVWGWCEKISAGRMGDVTKTVRKFLDDDLGWLKSNNEDWQAAVTAVLLPLLREVCHWVRLYFSADSALMNIGPLALMNAVDGRVRRLNDEEHRFLLADTAYFLREIMQGQDVPFVYERDGAHLRHIMIDEFQDTSRLQWENFVPLLLNALATGGGSLIVGDVKQSIYRWRGGDWDVLSRLPEHKLLGPLVETPPMDTNYRSAEWVVTWNNIFFERAVHHLEGLYESEFGRRTNEISTAYADVRQKWVPSHAACGYVEVCTVKQADKGSAKLSSAELDERQSVLLAEQVRHVLNEGVPPCDIAILVRENKDIELVRQAFAKYLPDVRLVSDEAFLLKNSPAISILIEALRVVNDPENMFHQHMLEQMLTHTRLTDPLPPREELGVGLLGLIENLYRFLRLDMIEGQDAYMFALVDAVVSFASDHMADLNSFLQYWDDSLCRKAISADGSDGVRIMTVHKSKGLEFNTVFVPFCDWAFSQSGRGNILWVEGKEAPFDEAGLLPLNFGGDLSKTIWSDDYADEWLRIYVDNLNLLYVAFTRASRNLFVIFTDSAGKGKNTAAQVMLNALPRDVMSTAETTAEVERLTYGQWQVADRGDNAEKTHSTDNVLLTVSEPLSVKWKSHAMETDFRLSGRARDFLDEQDDSQAASCITRGNLIHMLLSRIVTPDDIDSVSERMDFEGLFSTSAERDDIVMTVKQALADNDEARAWFTPELYSNNETAIVIRDDNGEVHRYRPDRVIHYADHTLVIDFKTGKPRAEHQSQLDGYVQLLQQMGYQNVTGRLWYINENEERRIDNEE